MGLLCCSWGKELTYCSYGKGSLLLVEYEVTLVLSISGHFTATEFRVTELLMKLLGVLLLIES